MPAQELAYEYFALALESTRGTAINNPTDYMNLLGMLTHKKAKRRAADNIGVLSDVIRSQTVKKWAEWTAEGDLDVNKVPLWAAMALNGGVSAVISQGIVDYVDVTTAGSGYTSAPTVSFSGGAGSGAAGVALLSGGTVVGVVVTAPGSGYTSAPTVAFSGGGGSSAAATAVIYKAGTLSKFWRFVRTLTSDNLKAASLYWGDPNVTVFRGAYGMIDEVGLSGDASGEDSMKVSLKGMSRYPVYGYISAIAVTAGGTGYTNGASGTFSGGGGSGAAATCTVSSGVITSVTITAPGTGYTSAPTLTFPTGSGATFTVSIVPVVPAASYGSMVMPVATQVWIDASEGYGVTPVTGRVISFEHTIPTGVTYKYVAAGPGGGLTYDHSARKRTHPVTKIVMELADLTQFGQYDNDTLVRFRIRHNGSLIETVSSVDHYNSIQIEGYAPFDALNWGSFEESNRTIELTLEHEYDAALGTDLVLWTENTRATL